MASIDIAFQESIDDRDCRSDSSATFAEHARQLRDRGFSLVRISPATKRPIGGAWSTRSAEPDELQPGDMLGIQGGALSDGGKPGHSLVIIDLDSPSAVEHADAHLPATAMVEGRAGKPRSHRYYLVPNESIPEEWRSKAEQAAPAAIASKGHPGPRKFQCRDAATNKVAIDFIGTGGQTVCPPSIHSSGECRDWEGGVPGEAAVVQFPALLAAVESLAAAANCRPSKIAKTAGVSVAAPSSTPLDVQPAEDPATGWQWSPDQDVAEREYGNALAAAVQRDGLPRTGRGGDAWTYGKLCYGLTGFGLRPERVLAAFCDEVNSRLRSVPDLNDPTKLVDDSWDVAELQRKLDIRVQQGPGTEYGSMRRHSTSYPSAPPSGRLVTRNLADVKPEPIEWLVPEYIPRGMLVLFAGPGGHGKSTITLHLASALSRGACAFNLQYPNPPRGKTLLVGCEDDVSRVVVPRLLALEADLRNIETVEHVNGLDGKPREFGLTHIAELEERLKSDPTIKLIVVDPISSFVAKAGRDEHKAGEVRSILDPLAKLAAQFGVCVLLVAHLNKNAKASAVDRIGGSGAFTTGVRAAYVFGRDPTAPDVRVFAPAKANILPNRNRGFAFKFEGIDANEVEQILRDAGSNLPPEDVAALAKQMFRPTWLPQVGYTADQIVQPSPAPPKNTRVDEAEAELLSLLDEYAWPDAEIRAALNARGISTSAYNRAKTRLTKLPANDPQRISYRQRGHGKERKWWFWKGAPGRPRPDREDASQDVCV